MFRIIDQAAAILVGLVGLAHVAVGYRVFVAPSERGVWFVAAGLLLVMVGLTNLARARDPAPSAWLCASALVGSLSILLCGALLGAASSAMLWQPQTLILLALGAVLAVLSARSLLTRQRQSRLRLS